MEKVPSQQHHIDILLFCEGHDLMKALPAIIASNGVSLSVANMIVWGYQYANCICSWTAQSVYKQVRQKQEFNIHIPGNAGILVDRKCTRRQIQVKEACIAAESLWGNIEVEKKSEI